MVRRWISCASSGGRVDIDDACLGGDLCGGTAGRGSENKVPVLAAVPTMPCGQTVLKCMRQQPHTEREVAVFTANHVATSATVDPDGLWRFGNSAMVSGR